MPQTHPQVSVILPTFDRERELTAAVASVLRQDFEDLELIVVDDASQDGTARLPCLRDDPRVRTIRLPRRSGGAAARNRGLEQAKGEWIAFQDSDDVWHPAKLSRQLAALQAARQADPEFASIFCRYRRRMPGGTEIVEPPDGAVPRDGRLLPALLRRSMIGTPTWMVSRTLLESLGGFDEAMPRLQDWELAIRAAAVSRIAFVDEILVDAGHTDNRLTRGHDRSLIEAETRIVEKHRDAMLSVGADCLAYRCWHLAHLHWMGGDAGAARRWLAEAQRHEPKFSRRLMGWLGAHPSAYRLAYRWVRGGGA